MRRELGLPEKAQTSQSAMKIRRQDPHALDYVYDIATPQLTADHGPLRRNDSPIAEDRSQTAKGLGCETSISKAPARGGLQRRRNDVKHHTEATPKPKLCGPCARQRGDVDGKNVADSQVPNRAVL
jgi:hypothetical protein